MRFEIRHRLQASGRVAATIYARRKALRNRPEPRLPLWRLGMQHDAANDLVSIQHNKIVVGPMRFAVMAGGLFEN